MNMNMTSEKKRRKIFNAIHFYFSFQKLLSLTVWSVMVFVSFTQTQCYAMRITQNMARSTSID